MTEQANCQSLLDSALGKDLGDDECEVLVGLMGVVRLNDGEVLVKEGDTVRTLFILVSGKLAVISRLNGIETKLYNMKPGECAGTRAFVDKAPRLATLQAVGEAAVYTLEPDNFESLLETHPRVVYKIMRGLFRLTHSNLVRMYAETQQLTNYINKTGGRY